MPLLQVGVTIGDLARVAGVGVRGSDARLCRGDCRHGGQSGGGERGVGCGGRGVEMRGIGEVVGNVSPAYPGRVADLAFRFKEQVRSCRRLQAQVGGFVLVDERRGNIFKCGNFRLPYRLLSWRGYYAL